MTSKNAHPNRRIQKHRYQSPSGNLETFLKAQEKRAARAARNGLRYPTGRVRGVQREV